MEIVVGDTGRGVEDSELGTTIVGSIEVSRIVEWSTGGMFDCPGKLVVSFWPGMGRKEDGIYGTCGEQNNPVAKK